MPAKRTFRKKSVDKKQTKRIKDLEKFVFKTIENKQLNYNQGNIPLNNAWYVTGQFLASAPGPEDGAAYGDAARIGNSITLMRQQVSMNIQKSTTDDYNQIRLIIVESADGNTTLSPSDVLLWDNPTTHGNLVFSSPYSTKTPNNKNYKIKLDKVFNLTVNKPTINIQKVIRYGKTGKVVDYTGPGVAQPTNHRLNFFVISDSGSAAHPFFDFNVRSTYKDA